MIKSLASCQIMYMNSSFLSPSRVPSGVIKKASWVGQGSPRIPNRPPPKGAQVKTSLSMEQTLQEIARDIWKSLGPGYSESVYHCAFEVALRDRLINYETERIIPVFYAGQNVGNVRADLIIDRKVVVELKSVSKLNETYRIQTQNYLQLLNLEQGYLINFPDKRGNLEFESVLRDRPVEPEPAQIDC